MSVCVCVCAGGEDGRDWCGKHVESKICLSLAAVCSEAVWLHPGATPKKLLYTLLMCNPTMWLLNFTNVSITSRESNQFCSPCTASCGFKLARMSVKNSENTLFWDSTCLYIFLLTSSGQSVFGNYSLIRPFEFLL